MQRVFLVGVLLSGLAASVPAVHAHDFYAGGTVTTATTYTSWTCNDKLGETGKNSQGCPICAGTLKVDLGVGMGDTENLKGSSQTTFSGDASVNFAPPGWKAVTGAKVGGAAGWTGSWSTEFTRFHKIDVKVNYLFTGDECIGVHSSLKAQRIISSERIRGHSFTGVDDHGPTLTGHLNQWTRDLTETPFYGYRSGTHDKAWAFCDQITPASRTTRTLPADRYPY